VEEVQRHVGGDEDRYLLFAEEAKVSFGEAFDILIWQGGEPAGAQPCPGCLTERVNGLHHRQVVRQLEARPEPLGWARDRLGRRACPERRPEPVEGRSRRESALAIHRELSSGRGAKTHSLKTAGSRSGISTHNTNESLRFMIVTSWLSRLWGTYTSRTRSNRIATLGVAVRHYYTHHWAKAQSGNPRFLASQNLILA